MSLLRNNDAVFLRNRAYQCCQEKIVRPKIIIRCKQQSLKLGEALVQYVNCTTTTKQLQTYQCYSISKKNQQRKSLLLTDLSTHNLQKHAFLRIALVKSAAPLNIIHSQVDHF